MKNDFFGKTLAACKIDVISCMIEFDIPVHGDSRGWFKENFQKEKMLPLGSPESFSWKGNCKITFLSLARMSFVVFTLNLGTNIFLSLNEGTVLGSWVDLREGDTFGNTYQTIIDASKGIFVPRGVANGFQVLSNKVAYSYLFNDYWALQLKPKYAFVNYADPSLDITWENLTEAEVSEADKKHPLLKDVKPVTFEKEELK